MSEDTLTAYKGFNPDWTCRDMQYEVGKTFKADGEIEPCSNGLHACEDPFDVLRFYSNPQGQYARVLASGTIKHEENKIATSELKIECSIGFRGLLKAGFSLVKKVCEESKEANTAGAEAHANTAGYYAIASSMGMDGTAQAALGSWIVLAEWDWRDGKYRLNQVKTAKVDGETIKADTAYKLVNGEFVEVSQ